MNDDLMVEIGKQLLPNYIIQNVNRLNIFLNAMIRF
jgi:hypothetical protein